MADERTPVQQEIDASLDPERLAVHQANRAIHAPSPAAVPDPRDREELAAALWDAWEFTANRTMQSKLSGSVEQILDALAPVVARREARAAAKALNDAAANYWRDTTLTRWPDVVVWLRARAAALDTEGKDHG